jgi:hypothetical protein
MLLNAEATVAACAEALPAAIASHHARNAPVAHLAPQHATQGVHATDTICAPNVVTVSAESVHTVPRAQSPPT